MATQTGADLFGATINFSNLGTNAIWAVIGLAIALVLLKWFFSAKTFTAAAMAIVAGAVLLWGVNAVQSGRFNDVFDHTVERSTTGNAPAARG